MHNVYEPSGFRLRVSTPFDATDGAAFSDEAIKHKSGWILK